MTEKDNFFLISEEINYSTSNRNIPGLFILLIKQNPSIEIPSEFSTILSQCLFGKMFCLLKKVSRGHSPYEYVLETCRLLYFCSGL